MKTATFVQGDAAVAEQLIEAPVTGLAAVKQQVRLWKTRRSIMNELSALSDDILADIGITRGEIYACADKAARKSC